MTTLPTLSVVRMPGPGERYSVSLGGGTYTVSASAGTCDCKGFFFRGDCKHVRALRQHLEEQRCCRACHGLGFLRLRSSYADQEPLPCARCEGTGLRQPADALPSDAELRAMFG